MKNSLTYLRLSLIIPTTMDFSVQHSCRIWKTAGEKPNILLLSMELEGCAEKTHVR